MREEIKLEDSVMDVVIKMSEGNPGAVTVLSQMLKGDDLLLLLHLDDMNIRGSQIWVGYKDHCHQDIELFKACIKSRDVEMVNTINNSGGVSPENRARRDRFS